MKKLAFLLISLSIATSTAQAETPFVKCMQEAVATKGYAPYYEMEFIKENCATEAQDIFRACMNHMQGNRGMTAKDAENECHSGIFDNIAHKIMTHQSLDVAALTVAPMPARGDELSIRPYVYHAGAYDFIISSHEDSITITSIKVNRGNCKFDSPRLPRTLGFGQGIRIGVFIDAVCTPIEVRIVTDHGELVFEPKE